MDSADNYGVSAASDPTTTTTTTTTNNTTSTTPVVLQSSPAGESALPVDNEDTPAVNLTTTTTTTDKKEEESGNSVSEGSNPTQTTQQQQEEEGKEKKTEEPTEPTETEPTQGTSEVDVLSDEHKPTPASASAGPAATDAPSEAVKEVEDAGPSLTITLLLITGTRHQLKIDGKYLRKRAVSVPDHDPFAMSVYTLKELIWRDWRSDWEPRPSSPSSIRLISFGKLLDDNAPLSDSKFSHDAPNVIHMTVKPQEVVDEEDAKGGKNQLGREREASERSPGCRCIIL
ncbi:hypothetical protein ASPZODRAFT_126763 [Penicilliopsis zonata CBS 506.65]|uniref:UBL3-like ubiquitin domain-containing protein n=1 Tax=Penicilliopsis zonata CBS 506.65 TaxID=1073090 RepID=A0A1L9SUB7_9EURO|nr:hypothetical protein ASPZODRAFT_126763 [Penicilliopsis zonata CBS 506.65]OJJ50815.1 hypothetical protein ASPZODRAFT_126763 [Penicilliopsis zonata CBS 506.65]